MRRLDSKSIILFFINGRIGPLLILAALAALLLDASLAGRNLALFTPGVTADSSLETAKTILALLYKVVLPVLTLFSLIWAWLQYANYKFELGQEAFRKEEGVIAKKYVSIPYEQIQNVDVLRNLGHRLIGLSEIQIQSAGMSDDSDEASGPAAEGDIPGLSAEEAEAIRNDLIHRASISQ
jgi:uncharacterized membrane protein YdbT with pleckstrin-like domain